MYQNFKRIPNCDNKIDMTIRARLDWAYFELMQIIKLLFIIHELLKVVYEKTTYEDKVFVSENLWIHIKVYLFE